MEDCQILEASNALETQQSVPEVNNSSCIEDSHLIARARAVGVVYEFGQPGVTESEDDIRKRQRRNQRRVTDEERRLREVIGDLPPPPPTGSSQLEDNEYFAIRKFEVEQTRSVVVRFARNGDWKAKAQLICVLAVGDIKRYLKFGQTRTTWTQCVFLRNCLICRMLSRC